MYLVYLVLLNNRNLCNLRYVLRYMRCNNNVIAILTFRDSYQPHTTASRTNRKKNSIMISWVLFSF